MEEKSPIKTLEEMSTMIPVQGQNFILMAIVTRPEVSEGESHGILMHIGTYETEEEAEWKMKVVMCDYYIRELFIVKSCQWHDIGGASTEHLVPVSDKGKVMEAQYRQMEEQRKEKEKRKKIRDDVEREQELAQEEGTIEEYIRLWYLVIKNRELMDTHLRARKEAQEAFEKRKVQLREAFNANPQYEEQWLDLLKKRLSSRGEEEVFEMIKKCHDKIGCQHLYAT